MTKFLHLLICRIPALVSAFALLWAVLGALAAAPALAGRLDNGRVVFDSPLDLVETAPVESVNPSDSSRSTDSGPSRHQIVIHVPLGAGEPLEAVVVTPYRRSASAPATAPTISFDTDATEAFVSRQGRSPRLEPVDLASVGGPSPDLNQALVVLAQPVLPGSTLTVVLTVDNPSDADLHEVEVTAYPAGSDSVGQLLGRTQLLPAVQD